MFKVSYFCHSYQVAQYLVSTHGLHLQLKIKPLLMHFHGFITYLYYKIFTQIPYIGGLNFYIDQSIAEKLSLNLGTLVLDTLSLISIVLFVQCDRLIARRILFLYWLSPINIYALYFHGQIDILPIFILLLSLLALQSWRFRYSGILLAVRFHASSVLQYSRHFILCLWQSINITESIY